MLSYSNANALLINEFDELVSAYNEDDWDFEYSPHCFYPAAFVPYIIKCLDDNNMNELNRIFNFVEKLFSEGDEDLLDMAGVSIVESVYYEPDYEKHKEKIYSLCGELTRKSFEDMERDE